MIKFLLRELQALQSMKFENHAHLCQQHEGVIAAEIPFQELDAMLLQRGHSVLLGRVQCRHHSLGSDLHLIGVHEPGTRENEASGGESLWPHLEMTMPTWVVPGMRRALHLAAPPRLPEWLRYHWTWRRRLRCRSWAQTCAQECAAAAAPFPQWNERRRGFRCWTWMQTFPWQSFLWPASYRQGCWS